MPIPFIDLSRLTREIAAGVRDDWADCLAKTEFVGGPRVAALEKELAQALGVPHAVTCANGTDALVIALRAIGVTPGMRVAMPNLTFWATYEAVEQVGATAVLVDVDSDDLQLSVDELRRAHDAHRFEAAIFVHLYGWTSARLGELRALCKERSILLLEDCAQGIGVEVGGRPVLEGSDAATLSFYPAKVIGGPMDGGAMTFRSEEHAAIARSLGNHGRATHYSYAHVGYNSRMGGLNAAFLSRMLARADDIVGKRRATAARYRELLASTPGVRVYGPPTGVAENGYLNVLTTTTRTGPELVDALKARGIGSARTYPEPMDAQPPAKRAIRFGELRVSREICARVLNLPLFWGIEAREIEESARALIESV